MVGNKSNPELLDEVIETELLHLSEMDAGSAEKSNAVKDLSELYKLRIEEVKAKQAQADSCVEAEMRQAQAKSQAFDRWLNLGVQVGLTVGGWVMYSVWYHKGLKFEETGTVRAPMTRNLLSRMLPRK